MKTIALMTAVALGGMVAMGAGSDTTSTTTTQDATTPGITCQKDGQGVSCDGTYWINVDTLTLAAANGDPIAQYAVAYITENGINGTPKDPDKAQALYTSAFPGLKEAADSGNPTACRALAHMYAHGKGVDKDETRSREFMKMCKDAQEKKDKDEADKQDK